MWSNFIVTNIDKGETGEMFQQYFIVMKVIHIVGIVITNCHLACLVNLKIHLKFLL